MKKKNKMLSDVAPLLSETYGEAKSQLVLEYAWERYEQLCAETASDSKAVKAHTHGDIFPCISLYAALQRAGVAPEAAVEFLDRSWSRLAEPKARSMQAMCKIPGVYKLMPRIFRIVTEQQFGEKAGFRATFYPTDSTRVKFDMTQCLYCDVCRRYGVPELVKCFCHTDDVTDGHIHPRLCWNRTKTMGEGGDVCDFDLIVTEKSKK